MKGRSSLIAKGCLKVGQVRGCYEILSLEAKDPKKVQGAYGRYWVHVRCVVCLTEFDREPHEIHTKPVTHCRKCRSGNPSTVVAEMPDGSVVSLAELTSNHVSLRLKVSKVSQAVRRSGKTLGYKHLKAQDPVSLKRARVKEFLVDGFSKESVAMALRMSVQEIEDLLNPPR